MRARFGWFPMPTFEFREWLEGLTIGVALCFAFDAIGRAKRSRAWLYALSMFFNGVGHTAVTMLGRTLRSV